MKSSKKNIFFLVVYFLIVSALTGYLIFNDYGVLKYLELKGEISELENEIKNSEDKIAALESEIDSLRNNLDKIEKTGREHHHMLRKNERGFSIREE